ncbi:hypothetical protein GCM10007874_12910 [Labrys miyagiensis]|uniref:DUF1444 family protein n=1 Tax=Labrys miyagiensis TaxID=346912 RepID=A0ABQ6CEQ9_9HYPH|nr:hypothetical protein [Labrys miyagiensis]GLS18274.1 hypothetical protein GCM10007874_12910 [Labrys miyagiensis]
MGLLDWLFSPKEVTREAFVQEAIELLERAGGTNFTFDAERFALRGADHTWFLDNAFARTKGLSKHKRRMELERFVATVIEAPTIDVSTLDMAAPLLKPTLRLRGRDATTQLQAMLDGSASTDIVPYAFEPLVDELIVRPVVDTQVSMLHVDAERLGEWGISVENALKIALANIRHEVVPAGFTRLQDGVLAGAWLPDYQPCAMLFPEIFRNLGLRGAPVVAPLTRGLIYVTGSEDMAGLARVLTLAEQSITRELYPCSASLYRHDGRSWSKFMPTGNSEVERLAHRVETLQAWELYETQQRLLNRVHEKTGIDIFVATFMVVERGPAMFSVSSWARNVLSLLPRTDVLAIQLEDGSNRTVSWEAAFEAFGDLMKEEPDLWPRRWRVKRSPGDAQITALPEYQSEA